MEEKEYLQGWPWFLGLVDAILVSIATLGVAYGADPFPELGKGRTALFFLWISAIREILNLVYKLYDSYSKKAYYVKSKSYNVECCKKTIPWCYGSNEEEEKEDMVKAATDNPLYVLPGQQQGLQMQQQQMQQQQMQQQQMQQQQMQQQQMQQQQMQQQQMWQQQMQQQQMQQQQMQIACPPGYRPGQKLQIKTASGQRLKVIIPQGIKPGDIFVVNI